MLADMAACRLVMVESSNASRTFQTSAWTGPTSFSNQLDWIDIRIAEHTTRIREGLRLVSRPRVAAAASAVDIKAVCPSHWTTASRHDGSPFLGTGAVRVRRRFRLHCTRNTHAWAYYMTPSHKKLSNQSHHVMNGRETGHKWKKKETTVRRKEAARSRTEETRGKRQQKENNKSKKRITTDRIITQLRIVQT
ncbi:hypothetical protein FALCPG4_001406 [Fusarium falciforme]